MITKTVYGIQYMNRFCTCNLKGYDSWHIHNIIVTQDFPGLLLDNSTFQQCGISDQFFILYMYTWNNKYINEFPLLWLLYINQL